jgi:hypothetical protein
MIKKIFTLFVFLVFTVQAFSQVYTNKVVGEKNQALIDSIEHHEYPCALPIWAKKATVKGFQLPYPAGFSVNYLWQESHLIIDDLTVRVEYGFLGSRRQFIGGLQYRFGL